MIRSRFLRSTRGVREGLNGAEPGGSRRVLASRVQPDVFAKSTRRFVLLGLSAALVALVVLALGVGALRIPPQETLGALLGQGLDARYQGVFWQLRLPRVLLGVAVGAALSVAGALIQGLFRNPLADPGLIGWHPFPRVYVGLATYEDQHQWTLAEFPAWAARHREHWAMLDRVRSWWRSVPELQRFVPSAAEPSYAPSDLNKT